ncbi:MAG TPA: HIT domain-containing protein [Chthonomonadales bacterium]|nr:HIT domain-containing protein [Chthonomonadales bacterium]
MDRLWAPWRHAYVESAAPVGGCIFCDFPAEERDAERFIVRRGQHTFVLLNAYPYSNGHLMVTPYRHIASVGDLNDAESLELMQHVQACVAALRKAFRPDGFNVGMNLGRVAGAGIDSHVHVHVVPRWNGDTSFMTVVGEVRVIPMAMDAAYDRLKDAFGG